MSAPLPNIRRGGEGAEAAAASGGKFARLNYMSIDEGKSLVVRFITDSPDWWYIKQHPSVPTKNAPADYKGTWPPAMPAVCRHDEAFKGIYTDCYICDLPIMNPRDTSKPLKSALRVWALAVEREAVVEAGVTKGYKTVMEEVAVRDEKGEETGHKITQPKILVVNFGMKNFFQGLQGIYGLFQTVTDRDMNIRRTGSGLDTDYQIIPLDPIETPEGRLAGPKFTVQKDAAGNEIGRTIVTPAHPSWAKFEKAVADQGIDLMQVIADRASDEYYGRFFDPTKTVASNNSGATNTSNTPAAASAEQQQQAPASDVVDQAKLQAMRDRVRGSGSNTDAAPAAEAASAPAEEMATAAASSGPVNYDE